MVNLASVWSFRGRDDKAIVMLRRAVALQEENLGPSHPTLALMLGNLANAELRSGRVEEAKTLYARVIAIQEQALGPEHPDLALALSGLGATAMQRGRPSEAVGPLERAVAIRSKGDVPPELLAEARFGLAQALLGCAGGSASRDHSRARGHSDVPRARRRWRKGVCGDPRVARREER